MWDIRSLKALGLDFDPRKNSFSYTFPPPYYAKKYGVKRLAHQLSAEDGWPDLSLYIHIPFCNIDCSFCSLHRQLDRQDGLLEQYLHALHAEINSYKDRFSRTPVTAIYFGGGTPSILTSPQIREILQWIQECFYIDKDIEVCMECAPDPHKTRQDWLSYFEDLTSMTELAVNRISFGTQSFDDKVLRNMGRQGGLQAVEALLFAADEKLQVYNTDLILGYPSLTPTESMSDAVNKTIASISKLLDRGFRLPSVSLYQLWDTATIPVTRRGKELPDYSELIIAKWQLQERLFELKYEPTVISSVIRDKAFEHRWIRNRHLDFRHIGLGSGVYSILPRTLVQRPRNINGYIQAMMTKPDEHELDVYFTLSPVEIELRRIIMGLRSFEWVSAEINPSNSSSEVDEIIQKTYELEKLELIERSNNMIRLSKDAFLIGNEISSYLHPINYPRAEKP